MPTDSSGAAPGLIPFAHPEALTDPEKLLDAYFRSSTVGLAILNREFRFIAINDALAGMNGVPAAEHLGKTIREVLGDFADLVEPNLLQVCSTRDLANVEVSATLPT